MAKHDLTQYPLWTALVTPLRADGTVDYPSLSQIVRHQADAGNALLLLGSTGEGLALSNAEQRQVVEYVVELKPEVPLMVAVGGCRLMEQQAWISFCNTLDIDAYLLASPLYAKPGREGQYDWFSHLLETAAHPCMIYNVPSRAGVDLDPLALARLTEFDNFWAIKEASGSLARFESYRDACPNVALYSGDDGLFPQHAALGAAGLVSVCANVWPQATSRYVNEHLSNRGEPIEPMWQQAIDSLFTVANPIPVKVLMHRLKPNRCAAIALTFDSFGAGQPRRPAQRQ